MLYTIYMRLNHNQGPKVGQISHTQHQIWYEIVTYGLRDIYIYMLNLKAQHSLLTEIYTFNRDMFVGGMYT